MSGQMDSTMRQVSISRSSFSTVEELDTYLENATFSQHLDYAKKINELEQMLAAIKENCDATDGLRRRTADTVKSGTTNNVPVTEPPDFTEWDKQRRRTTATIEDVIKRLDTITVNCNVAKATGEVAEITGAITQLIGLFATLFGGNGGAAMDIGRAISATGNVTSVGSDLVETVMTNLRLKEVRKILEQDQKLSKTMDEFMTFSRDLNRHFIDIFGHGLESLGQLKNRMEVFQDVYCLVKSGVTVPMAINRTAMKWDISPDCLTKFGVALKKNPRLGEKMNNIAVYSSVLGASLHLYQLGTKIYHFFAGTKKNVALPMGNIDPALFTPRNVSIFCAVQLVNIAASILSLDAAVEAIKKGKSKYSESLQKLSNLLEMERKTVMGIKEN